MTHKILMAFNNFVFQALMLKDFLNPSPENNHMAQHAIIILLTLQIMKMMRKLKN